MLKAAPRLIVRLLPCMAAMVASVAIGASTLAAQDGSSMQQPAPPPSMPLHAARAKSAAGEARSTLATDNALIARAQTLDVLATYPVGTLDPVLSAPAPVAAVHDDARPLFRLPRPDRWTALLATLALAAFFFVRRIV